LYDSVAINFEATRLFLVLPYDHSSWQKDPISHRFCLYFMCDYDDMGQVHLLFLRFGKDKFGTLEVDGVTFDNLPQDQGDFDRDIFQEL